MGVGAGVVVGSTNVDSSMGGAGTGVLVGATTPAKVLVADANEVYVGITIGTVISDAVVLGAALGISRESGRKKTIAMTAINAEASIPETSVNVVWPLSWSG